MAIYPPPDSIVFDLDGTLWDTNEACALAWNRVVARNGIHFREITAGDVRGVVGQPHEACIRSVFAGLSERALGTLIQETMIEDNIAVAEQGGKLFEGVAEGLVRLAGQFPLFIVSNCQAGYIELFLELHGFADLFQDFECWGNTQQTKGENLAALIRRNRLVAPLMVGDTDGDFEAARENPATFVQVAWGFGPPIEGTLQAGRFEQLVEMILATKP